MTAASRGEKLFNRALVPVDGSESSEKAARFALHMAGHRRMRSRGLHVVDEEMALIWRGMPTARRSDPRKDEGRWRGVP